MQPLLENYRHIQIKRESLSTSISGIRKIYLDTNFWVQLQQEGIKKDSSERRLLDMLTRLVAEGKCIVAVSDINIWEVLKQSDPQTLLETVKVIDVLSNGVGLVGEQERMRIEFMHYVKQDAQVRVPQDCWIPLSLILMQREYSNCAPEMFFDVFIDFLCRCSLYDIINRSLISGNHLPFSYKDDVNAQNEAKVRYAHENKSFDQMFLSELGGLLEVHNSFFNIWLEEMFFSDSGRFPTEQERKAVNKYSYSKGIYNLFRLKKITTELPTFRIFAELNAAARWNTTRKYKDGNDTIDFKHACAALPYFDYFFTERELKAVISQRRLDILYACHVESNPQKILTLLSAV